MNYRAVENRVAVILDFLKLPLSREETLAILADKGFTLVNVDLIALARSCMGSSRYRRSARPSEAPEVVDCSSFTKWLYGQRGIWLPRRSIQQYDVGVPVDLRDVVASDLVFISGRIDYYVENPAHGIGHVGIATGNNTIIHAANRKDGVIEIPLEKFIGVTKFRGVRRYLPNNHEVLTFETPKDREVEVADDIKWIVLQSLPIRRW